MAVPFAPSPRVKKQPTAGDLGMAVPRQISEDRIQGGTLKIKIITARDDSFRLCG
jgi:hypothetical protein